MVDADRAEVVDPLKNPFEFILEVAPLQDPTKNGGLEGRKQLLNGSVQTFTPEKNPYPQTLTVCIWEQLGYHEAIREVHVLNHDGLVSTILYGDSLSGLPSKNPETRRKLSKPKARARAEQLARYIKSYLPPTL